MATGIITTGSIPKFLWEGIRGIWGVKYPRYEKQYERLFDVIDSKKAWEEFVQRTGLAAARRKYEGSAVTYDGMGQGFTARITNLSYGTGFIITEEAFEDNLYAESAMTDTEEIMRAIVTTQETIAANIYNQGFNTSPGVAGADGVALLSTAHPNFNGGTFSNTTVTATSLSESSLEDMVIQIRGTTDDRGQPVMLVPKCLILSKSEEFNAQRILKSQYRSGGGDNDINVLGQGNYIPDIYINVYLTNPHYWFLRTNIPTGKGMIFLNRRAPAISKDDDFDTSNMKVKATTRFGVGFADGGRAVFGSSGA